MRTFARALCALLLLALSGKMALAQEEPTWPRPPTNDDCRQFGAAYYQYLRDIAGRQADCPRTNGHQCVMEWIRRSGEASRKQVPLMDQCWREARIQEARDCGGAAFANRLISCEDAKELAADALQEQLEDLHPRVGKAVELGKDLADLKGEYDKLKDFYDRARNPNASISEKLRLTRDMAQELNGRLNTHPLSQQLTQLSIDGVAMTAEAALGTLDRRLREVERAHRSAIQQKDLAAGRNAWSARRNRHLSSSAAPEPKQEDRAPTVPRRDERPPADEPDIAEDEEEEDVSEAQDSKPSCTAFSYYNQCMSSCSRHYDTTQQNCRNRCFQNMSNVPGGCTPSQ